MLITIIIITIIIAIKTKIFFNSNNTVVVAITLNTTKGQSKRMNHRFERRRTHKAYFIILRYKITLKNQHFGVIF